MKQYIIYNPETGRIQQVVNGGSPLLYKDGHWFDESTVVMECTGQDVDPSDRVDIETGTIYRPEKTANIEDIKSAIRLGFDPVLDETIATYLAAFDIEKDVQTWRRENWEMLRTWAYPPIEDYVDAQVKQTDPDRAEEGRQQALAYLQKCMIVKSRFPKEE